ncbi:ROK family transcriptional regulator [Dactylosporangium sp. AC04546]|uniref:ROK family transcriptional regulator n=1 Tax=Dactylosporangium sp. AC04546 TaxID=2862460 RepID=UPI001EDEA6A9|nr:ROK family transcriptional regulator [Dactylosporangium sp. AC04546]WVK86997.1 ROK family transcriptional regulator [Dactylosporangium sp. AC04546]
MMLLATPTAVADATAASIFVTVLARGPIARSEIAAALGLSAGTISRAVRPLLDSGYLAEDGAGGPPRLGRPVVPLRVVADREFMVGVKLTADHVCGVVVDLLAQVRASREAAVTDTSVPAVVATVTDLVEQLRADAPGPVTRIGIGVGGHVDSAAQLIRYAPFLNWRDVALPELVSATTGLPVVVENDVNSLTAAEQWFGAGVDVPSFAVVTIGAGIGCGLVIDGRLVHGAVGLAGELGHIPLSADGPRCRCGNTGCVETVASEEAILRRVRAASGRDDLDMATAVALGRAGDRDAVDAFTAAGDALGRALAVVANLINPHRIVLSGEGLAASDLFESAARASFATHAFGQAVECDLITRPLPDHTWARGAAAVAIQHLFLGPTPTAGR